MLPGGRVHPSSAYFLHPDQWENLARFPRDIFPGGETLLGSRGTFSQAGKPGRARGEHFPRQENLVALVGNIFPSGKTLPRSWGTFSQAGKPCRARGEHFPGRGNLAALVGNVFPGGKSLPRSAATLLRAWKPCCVSRQGFNDNLLATIISCSLTSGRMQYALYMGEHAKKMGFHGKTKVCSPPSFPIRPYSWRQKTK